MLCMYNVQQASAILHWQKWMVKILEKHIEIDFNSTCIQSYHEVDSKALESVS